MVARSPRPIARAARTIAVVGLSRDPDKLAHVIPASLQSVGYRIIPVNPALSEVLGEPSRASLREITEDVGIVQVFRPAAEAPAIAADAAAIEANVLWLQQGIRSPQAWEIAISAGLEYVEDTCPGATVATMHADAPADER